jgi:hypothetical protein
MRSELVDVAAELIHQTPLAYLLDDGKVRVWVPKSAVEDNRDGTWAMSERLATEKGFF